MRLFEFELIGLQVVYVKCPKCGDEGTLVFAPSNDSDCPELPLSSKVLEEIKKLGINTTLPHCDDAHFHCMNCLSSSKMCSVRKGECKLTMKTHGRIESKSIESLDKLFNVKQITNIGGET